MHPDADGRGWSDVGREGVALERTGLEVLPRSLGVLKTAFLEAPEVAANRRRSAAADNGGHQGNGGANKALIVAGAAGVAVAAAATGIALSRRKSDAAGDTLVE